MKFLAGSITQALSLLLLVVLPLTGCTPAGPTLVEIAGPTMGTSYSVKVVLDETQDPGEVQAALEKEIAESLEALNGVFSTYIEDSELSALNAKQGDVLAHPISFELSRVLAMSREVYDLSGGAFDVTVGPLVNLWGFGPDGPAQGIPDTAELQQVLAQVGFDRITLMEERISRPPNVYIDLSAIAKGYAVDRISDLLETRNITRYMVEIGGEVRTRGHNARDVAWVIGLEAPDRLQRRLLRTLPVLDQGMATSGDYRNFFTHEGKRYSHTIDPRTGWPVQHQLASVTVLNNSAAMADALATAFLVMGPDATMDLAEQMNLRVLAIMRTDDHNDPYREVLSTGMQLYLQDLQATNQ